MRGGALTEGGRGGVERGLGGERWVGRGEGLGNRWNDPLRKIRSSYFFRKREKIFVN